MAHQVDIVKTPAITVAVVRFRVASADLPAIGEQMGRAFGTVAEELGRADIATTGPAIASYVSAADGFEVAAGFPVASSFTASHGLARLDLGDVEAAHTTHIGPYSDLPSAYRELEERARDANRSLDAVGTMWEEYWSEPGTPGGETRTEIYWPLAPAGTG